MGFIGSKKKDETTSEITNSGEKSPKDYYNVKSISDEDTYILNKVCDRIIAGMPKSMISDGTTNKRDIALKYIKEISEGEAE